MLQSMKEYPQYQPVIAGAPGIDKEFYAAYLADGAHILYGGTYRLLKHSHAALVTSGSATLETALFRVPQVVCYATPMSRLYSWLKKHFLKVKFVSLVNLIAGSEVVRELVAADMRLDNVKSEIGKLLPGDSPCRLTMLKEYDRVIEILGEAGASERAADIMVALLRERK
jgi:lipid-A-disaccharide synthase